MRRAEMDEGDFGAGVDEAASPPRGVRFKVREERGTRFGGSLDASQDLRLAFPAEWYKEGGVLDEKRFVSRVINDEGIRLHQLTTQDGWDFVLRDGTAGLLDLDVARSESLVVTQPVGTDAAGRPLIGFLCRKPRAEWQEKQDAMVARSMQFQKDALNTKSAAELQALAGSIAPHAGTEGYQP